MQDFIIAISDYARGIDNDFIIIPQNGAELLFNETDPEAGFHPGLLTAVNGIGIEELFYDGALNVDEERLSMLRQIVTKYKVMVADYVTSDGDIADDILRCHNEGFICFPRCSANYDYILIPDSAIGENSDDITSLNQAKNYLYLISNGGFSSKESMLQAITATNFDVVIIDAFYDDTPFTAAEIAQLKTKANGGKRLVISYINVGAAEKFRYYWKKSWHVHCPGWLKKKYEGYDDEIWVKFWKSDWQDIIYGNDDSYMKKILDAGFDGAYLDNVEAYYFLYED